MIAKGVMIPTAHITNTMVVNKPMNEAILRFLLMSGRHEIAKRQFQWRANDNATVISKSYINRLYAVGQQDTKNHGFSLHS